MIDQAHLDIQEAQGLGVELPSIDEKIEIGKRKNICQEGNKLAILSFGTTIKRMSN